MAGNQSLNAAAKAKEDEFYTLLSDIEKELKHYRNHFKDKVVFCNCDDPFESNFFKYFVLNFNRLGLKKLICTSFEGSPIANTQLSLFDIDNTLQSKKSTPYKAIVTTVYDKTGDGSINLFDVAALFKSGENELSELKGNGDFRSEECVALLKESDIVVTNPPFSKFREFVEQLIKYNKQFIVIGNKNSFTDKDIFPLLTEHKMWIGYESPKLFDTPNGLTDRVQGLIRWYTNLDIKKSHEELILVKKYNAEDYPKYVNYDAINVERVVDIPCDYDGEMGVPITFFDKYNPDQFEIIGSSLELAASMKDFAEKGSYMTGGPRFYTENLTESDKKKNYKYHREYERLVIRNKKPEKRKDAKK